MADGVTEMRLVVTAPDYEEALAFYRDVLGLPLLAAFDDGAGHVTILDAGRATLELSDVPHAEHIDRVEVGPPGRRAHPGGVRGPRRRRRDGPAGRGRRDAHRPADADAVALAQLAAGRAGRPPADAVPEPRGGVLGRPTRGRPSAGPRRSSAPGTRRRTAGPSPR